MTQSKLNGHIRAKHEKVRNHTCEFCDFSFNIPSQLKQHIKTVHENIKDIECEFCEYRTGDKSAHIEDISNLFITKSKTFLVKFVSKIFHQKET